MLRVPRDFYCPLVQKVHLFGSTVDPVWLVILTAFPSSVWLLQEGQHQGDVRGQGPESWDEDPAVGGGEADWGVVRLGEGGPPVGLWNNALGFLGKIIVLPSVTPCSLQWLFLTSAFLSCCQIIKGFSSSRVSIHRGNSISEAVTCVIDFCMLIQLFL